MSTPTLYLHIGTGKTGTSALQDFLFYNRDTLLQQGYLYPLTGLDEVAHHPLGQYWDPDRKPEEPGSGGSDHLWPRIADEFRTSGNNLILSTETLARAFAKVPGSLAEVQEHLTGLPVKVIIYLRRQDQHLESYYNQLIKAGLATKQQGQNNRDDQFYDYHRFLNTLASCFGKDNLIVRLYEPAWFVGGSIYQDFCHATGIHWEESFFLPGKDPNPKLEGKYLDLMSLANEIDRPWERKYWLNYAILNSNVISRQNPSSSGHLFTHEQRKAFLARYAESNALVAREYFGQEDGHLFEDIAAPVNETSVDDPLTAEDAAALLVDVFDSIWPQWLDTFDQQQRLQEQRDEITSSFTWKVMAPIRWLGARLKPKS